MKEVKMKNKIMISDICEAFKSKAVGSKVHPQHLADFFDALDEAVSNYDFSQGKVVGQAVIDLPSKVNDFVSPGSWKRGSTDPNDFVLRKYRGEVGMHLRRKPDMTSARVRVVVYTRNAYENDPDFTEDEALNMEEFFGNPFDGGYVLVAVLGDPDKNPSTVSFSRFVRNLAGANNEYAVMSKDELVTLAKKVDAYRSLYMGVAD